MYLAERKLYHVTEQISALTQIIGDIDNYVSLYRCALKIADIVLSYNPQEVQSRSTSKNVWQRLMKIPSLRYWAELFLLEGEYAHQVEDGFIRWIDQVKYHKFITEIHEFTHVVQNFLEINNNCQLCLSERGQNISLELVS